MSPAGGGPAERPGDGIATQDTAPVRCRRPPLPAWLLIAVLIYTLVYSLLSVIRHDTFHSYTFDLGILAQTIWNTSQGRLFETSIDRAHNVALIGSYLGNHVRPILLLMAPLYRLWPDPRLLLVLQSLALGLGAVPLYWVARRTIGKRSAEMALVCAYLAYPALGYANLFDFHPQVLSIPFLLLAYWARIENRRGLFWGAAVLALATKEELAVPLGAWGVVGLLLALWQRATRRRDVPPAYHGVWTNLGLVALAGAWAGLSLGVIVPLFNDGRPYRFLELWAHLWTGVPSLSWGALLGVHTEPNSLLPFLLHLLLPLGYAPMLGPAGLGVSVPSFAYLVLGERAALHSVGYHYPSVLIPWLFLATIEGFGWLARRLPSLLRWATFWLVLGSVLAQLPFNPIVAYALVGAFRREPDTESVAQALRLIPAQAGVATINRFGAHLSHRRVLLPLEYPSPLRLDHLRMVDYVLLDLVDCRAVDSDDKRWAYTQTIGTVLASGDFRVAYRADRIVLLVRDALAEEAGCVTLSQGGPPTCAPGAACARSELCQVATAVAELATQERPCWP